MKSRGLIVAAAFLVSLGLHAGILIAHIRVLATEDTPETSPVFHLVNAVVVRPPSPAPPKPSVEPESQAAAPPVVAPGTVEPEVVEPPSPAPRDAPTVAEEKPKKTSPPPRQELPPRQLRPQVAASASPRRPSAAAASPPERFLPMYRVDRPPDFLKRAPLGYPVQARRFNVEGSVVIEADIDENGTIVDARVAKGVGFGLDESALAYVLKSTYSPAYAAGRPVAVRMRFTIRFRLR